MYPVREYFPDENNVVKAKNGVHKILDSINKSPGYVNLNGSHNSTFEKSIIGSHRKVLFGRRVITGLAYYAYFLLALQCGIGILLNDFSVKSIILSAFLLPLTVFVMVEVYVDTRTTMFSMTSIMSELIMRKFFEKYNAINAINTSWNETKHRDMSSAIRYEMSNNRDNILFLYATNKSKEKHMKLTYFIISPSMESVWGKIFPSLYNKLSIVLDGGVVQSIHSISIGTPYSVVSTMDFTISRDNMLMGFTKYVLNSLSFKNMKNDELPTCENVTDSIHDNTESFNKKHSSADDASTDDVSTDDVSIKTSLFKGVSDSGSIEISGVNFRIQFEVDRLIENMEIKNINYTQKKDFEFV